MSISQNLFFLTIEFQKLSEQFHDQLRYKTQFLHKPLRNEIESGPKPENQKTPASDVQKVMRIFIIFLVLGTLF